MAQDTKKKSQITSVKNPPHQQESAKPVSETADGSLGLSSSKSLSSPPSTQTPAQNISLIVSTKEYFSLAVDHALAARKLKPFAMTQTYLVEVLERHLSTESLFDDKDSSGKMTRDTLAEMYFKAQNTDSKSRVDLLKKLGDRSLYISGFFADSLQRKIIDIDYYIDMGGAAYGALADQMREDVLARVFRELSSRFMDFVDVLSVISEQSRLTDEANILRLYETYARTGSELARDRLHERGLIAVPMQPTGSDPSRKL
jgi:Ca2+-binding EF-hand superfamily protein